MLHNQQYCSMMSINNDHWKSTNMPLKQHQNAHCHSTILPTQWCKSISCDCDSIKTVGGLNEHWGVWQSIRGVTSQQWVNECWQPPRVHWFGILVMKVFMWLDIMTITVYKRLHCDILIQNFWSYPATLVTQQTLQKYPVVPTSFDQKS